MPFDNDTSVSFKLPYPANSQLVAVVSDATGFGSGGTSVGAQVTSSGDASCFDASKSVSPIWTFSLNTTGLAQCTTSRISWNAGSAPQGTPNFYGVIPGGESFQIPVGNIDDESNAGQGTGFSWKPNLVVGTTVIIVAGDNRGNGTGGSDLSTVSGNINNDASCLNNNSPSSTPGSPAGGSYPTNSNGAGTGGNGGSSNNTGAIIGGVIGGVVFVLAVLLTLLFFWRRKRLHEQHREKPAVDLLVADEGDEPPARPSRNELPEYYQPEPFVAPDPTAPSESSESDRRQSYLSSSTDPLSSSGAPTSSTKARYQPRQMRPVNIIQHDDAGPSYGLKEEQEPETIELPPAYTNIRGGATPATTPAADETTTATPPPQTAGGR